MSERFRLLHDTQVSKVALCSVRLDNKEFNSKLETQESHVTEKSAIA